ncbi:MAG: 30S ribosomal protein S6 [Nitrospirota bacterium]
MNDYESIFILAPSTEEGESEKISQRFQEVITANGGEIVRVEKWGKRKLAYPVRKHKKGEYVLLQFRGGAMAVSELERNYKMTDAVIKFLTIRLEKEALAHLARQLQAQQKAEMVAETARAEESRNAEATVSEAEAGEPAEAMGESGEE